MIRTEMETLGRVWPIMNDSTSVYGIGQSSLDANVAHQQN